MQTMLINDIDTSLFYPWSEMKISSKGIKLEMAGRFMDVRGIINERDRNAAISCSETIFIATAFVKCNL